MAGQRQATPQQVFGHDVKFDVAGNPIEQGIGALQYRVPAIKAAAARRAADAIIAEGETAAAATEAIVAAMKALK